MQFIKVLGLAVIASMLSVATIGSSAHEGRVINKMAVRRQQVVQQMQAPDNGSVVNKKQKKKQKKRASEKKVSKKRTGQSQLWLGAVFFALSGPLFTIALLGTAFLGFGFLWGMVTEVWFIPQFAPMAAAAVIGTMLTAWGSYDAWRYEPEAEIAQADVEVAIV